MHTNNIFFNFVIAQVISVPTDSGYHLPAGRQQEPGKISDEMIAQLKDKIESMPEKKNTAKDSRRLQILCEEAKRNKSFRCQWVNPQRECKIASGFVWLTTVIYNRVAG